MPFKLGVTSGLYGIARGEELASAGLDPLDRMLALERFTPNYRADGCPYCPHKALCLKPDLYRTGGQPW